MSAAGVGGGCDALRDAIARAIAERWVENAAENAVTGTLYTKREGAYQAADAALAVVVARDAERLAAIEALPDRGYDGVSRLAPAFKRGVLAILRGTTDA